MIFEWEFLKWMHYGTNYNLSTGMTPLKKLMKIYTKNGGMQFYPSLNRHEIPPLSKRYGKKVWQSYLENKASGARRMYWIYGPGKQEITIIGLEPHPEDKKNGAYDRIKLSDV